MHLLGTIAMILVLSLMIAGLLKIKLQRFMGIRR